jgi:hypothetical protein
MVNPIVHINNQLISVRVTNSHNKFKDNRMWMIAIVVNVIMVNVLGIVVILVVMNVDVMD